MVIRKIKPADYDGLWAILKPVLRAGATYTLPRNMSRENAILYWDAAAHQTFVAIKDNQIIGTYYLRDNQAGPGDHVCNCGYVVADFAAGKGVAKALNAHSVQTAENCGYRAMQFNAVVSTNTRAVTLWQRCGFDIVGTLPGAFLHPDDGYVDAYIMYRDLTG